MLRIIFLLFFTPLAALAPPPKIKADAAILVNANTGAILYEKNIHAPKHPASTMKILTALYAIEKKGHHLDAKITADREAIGSVAYEEKVKKRFTIPSWWLDKDASHIGIKAGEEFSFRDLLHGLLVASGDDAANVIAMHVSGTIPRFIDELNQYAKSLGLQTTYFTNPHGLHHPDQVTTAYELSIIARKAMQNPLFRQMVAMPTAKRPKTNKQEEVTLTNTNKLIKKSSPHYYEKAIGIKTGYTQASRHCLVSCAKDGDRTLIAVILDTPERDDKFSDSKALFEWAFSHPPESIELVEAGEQPHTLDLPGASSPVKTYSDESYTITFYPGEKPPIKASLTWHTLTLPIDMHQHVATLTIQTHETKEIPLYALEPVEKSWKGSIKEILTGKGSFLSYAFLFILLIGLFVFLRR